MSLEAGGARSLVKRVVRGGLLALVSVGLIYFLVSRAGLTWSALAHSIAGFAGWGLACYVVLTCANLALGSLKWLLVLRVSAPNQDLHPRLCEAMLATALGEFVGQAMPVQAGIALARSFASHLGVGGSLRGNLGTTIYEQLFDLIVLCVAACTGLLALTLHLGPIGRAGLILPSILAAVFISLRLPALLAVGARWLGKSPSVERSGFFSGFREVAARSTGISSLALLQLTMLSILRYVANLMRVVVLLGALGMWAYAVPALIGFPLIQVAGVVPITPGNLGVIEWTWSAVLMSAGATLGAAALFAVTARMVNIVALSIVTLLLAGVLILPGSLMIWRWRER